MKKHSIALLLLILLLILTSCGKPKSSAEKFSEKHAISTELAQSIEDALLEINFPVALDELTVWKQIDDYADGQRYTAQAYLKNEDSFCHLLFYVQNETVASIYNLDDNRSLIYRNAELPSELDTYAENQIYLSEGTLGEYGKEVTIPSQTYGEYTYIWYCIPAGNYLAINKSPADSERVIFIVGDSSSEDVRATIYLNKVDEECSFTIEEGTHIELSLGTQLLLTPAE